MDIGSYLQGIATGGLIGTLFWLFALLRYFPRKFQITENRIRDEIERKEIEYMSKIENKITDISEDIDNKVKSFKIDPKTILEPILGEFNKDPKDWDPEIFKMLTTINSVILDQMIFTVKNDPRVSQLITDKMKGISTSMKKEFYKEVDEMVPRIADKYGMGGLLEDDPNKIFEEMGDMGKLAKGGFMLMKMFGMGPPGTGQGLNQLPAHDPYGGY